MTKTTQRLLTDLRVGQTRVFYAVEVPTGWAEAERRGWAVRVSGTDRAVITEVGRAALAAAEKRQA